MENARKRVVNINEKITWTLSLLFAFSLFCQQQHKKRRKEAAATYIIQTASVIVKLSKMQDKICEIPAEKWAELRDLFLPNWPRNIYAYNLLENYIRWLAKDPNIKNLKMYSLNDDWSDGTFVVVVSIGILQNVIKREKSSSLLFCINSWLWRVLKKCKSIDRWKWFLLFQK